MKHITKLYTRLVTIAAVGLLTAATAWGQTTVSYGWEDSDDATQWTITDAIAKTSDQGNSGTYAGKINTNHTYVQFNEKVNVTSFSFAFKRTSNNNNYNVYIETSTDGTTWSAVETYAMSSFSNGSYTTKTKTFDGSTAYYVRFHCYNTTAVRYVDDVSITYSTGSSTPTPSINASNVDLAYDATSGSIAYTIENGVDGGAVSASVPSGSWLTLGSSTASPISFTCSSNSGVEARIATVTLTYTYETNQTVTKAVTVTQEGNPTIINNISDITTTGTYAVRGTIVAKSQRGFIVGDGTGYVYYYNQNYTQANYNIGDKVKLSGAVTTYGNVYQFTSSAVISSASESSYAAEDPTVLTGSQMDTRVSTSENHLSEYVQYQGTLSVSDNHYNITNISGASTAQGSISYPISTDFTSLKGKTVIVKGYYVGVSSKQYYNTLIGSIEEVPVPTLVSSPTSLTSFTYEVGNGPSDSKTISVSGSYLTSNIGLVLNDNSAFEISLAENSGYTNSLTLTPVSGAVAATNVYVRLKADKNIGDYTGSITISSTGASTVSVNLTGNVSASAVTSLPFEFDGGRDDIASTAGLSSDGLGADYGSSPKLKFDGTGDWVLLQFDERPGVLSFDIKGNSFSGGTFKVQTSADGVTYTDLETYAELGDTQEEEFKNLAADVRYIKWIYTSKSSGNVALGNISLAAYTPPVPSIVVDPATVDVAATIVEPAQYLEGTLDITYENLTISDMDDFAVQFYDSEGEEASAPSWIEVEVSEQDPEVGEGYVVSYMLSENDGAARSAYFKVFAVGDQDYVYSNLVTITQAAVPAPVLDYATLPFSWAGGTQAELLALNGVTAEGLGSNYAEANAPYRVKFDTDGDYILIKTNEQPGVVTIGIKKIGGAGDSSITIEGSSDGENFTTIQTFANEGAQNDINTHETTVAFAASDRYVKILFNKPSSGGANVGVGPISIEPVAVNPTPETYTLTATLGDGAYWTTFYNGSAAYTLSEGAQAFTMNASKQLYRLGTDGTVVPENTAVVIISDVPTVTLTKTADAGTAAVNGGANILQGSNAPVAKTGTQYVLGKKNNKIGFYLFNGTSIPANKAYYVVNE